MSADDVQPDLEDLPRELLPTLRTLDIGARGDAVAWAKELVSECRERLSVVLPLTAEEREFLTRLNDRGEIAPELLTNDHAMQATIREHPALLWKALNAKRRGGEATPEDLL